MVERELGGGWALDRGPDNIPRLSKPCGPGWSIGACITDKGALLLYGTVAVPLAAVKALVAAHEEWQARLGKEGDRG